MTELVVLRCQNPLCRHVLKKGSRKIVGEAAPGSVVRLKCEACGQIAVHRPVDRTVMVGIP